MIGSSILSFDTIDSTNDYIKNNLNNLNDGQIIIAKTQTKGRGRFENVWQSYEGNLYFSFLLKQTFENDFLFKLQMLVSVLIVKILKKYGISSKIKFPNDILVNGKKIAGILTETSIYSKVDSIIVGIGINVNQTDFRELNKKATSVNKETDKSMEVRDVLVDFIDLYNKTTYNQQIYNDYIALSDTISRTINYQAKDYQIKNILPNGSLVLVNDRETIEVNYTKLSLSQTYI